MKTKSIKSTYLFLLSIVVSSCLKGDFGEGNILITEPSPWYSQFGLWEEKEKTIGTNIKEPILNGNRILLQWDLKDEDKTQLVGQYRYESKHLSSKMNPVGDFYTKNGLIYFINVNGDNDYDTTATCRFEITETFLTILDSTVNPNITYKYAKIY